MPWVALIAAALSITSMAGCAIIEDVFSGRSDTYIGTVAFGFEESGFRPCNVAEQWWITGGDMVNDLQSRYNDLGVKWYEPVFAELKGDPSQKGQYGHLGAYQREFEVSEVIEMRLLEAGECRP